jgi:phosphoglucosamine mutase
MMESAMVAGFNSVGMDVVLLGPMPTPAVAMLTRSMRADLGVMISASHNPFADNGIKLFGPDGYRLSDKDEAAIERRLEQEPKLARPELIGRARRIDDARGRYVHYAKSTFPERLRLDGLKIVVDCANGAAYHVAPDALWELGAEVVPLGTKPNGLNINDQCGSTYPQLVCETVVASGADIGLALDGDADRLIVVDEKGRIIDGDQMMALIALNLQRSGALNGGAVVATVMSNLGLERKLAEAGLGLTRTQVGDRYVLEEMRASGCNVGGEQSGHIILSDHSTTGDGLVAGLQVLAALVEMGRPASEVLSQHKAPSSGAGWFRPVPPPRRRRLRGSGCASNRCRPRRGSWWSATWKSANRCFTTTAESRQELASPVRPCYARAVTLRPDAGSPLAERASLFWHGIP